MPRLSTPWRPIARRYPERNPADPLAGFIGWLFKDVSSTRSERILARVVVYLLIAILVSQAWHALAGGAS